RRGCNRIIKSCQQIAEGIVAGTVSYNIASLRTTEDDWRPAYGIVFLIQCSAANRISAPHSFKAERDISTQRAGILRREVEQAGAGWRHEVAIAGANSRKFKIATARGYSGFQRQSIFVPEYYLYSGDYLIVIVSNLA